MEKSWSEESDLWGGLSSFWLSPEEEKAMRGLKRKALVIVLLQVAGLLALLVFTSKADPGLGSLLFNLGCWILVWYVNSRFFASLPTKKQCWLVGHTPTVISCDRCGEETGNPPGMDA